MLRWIFFWILCRKYKETKNVMLSFVPLYELAKKTKIAKDYHSGEIKLGLISTKLESKYIDKTRIGDIEKTAELTIHLDNGEMRTNNGYEKYGVIIFTLIIDNGKTNVMMKFTEKEFNHFIYKHRGDKEIRKGIFGNILMFFDIFKYFTPNDIKIALDTLMIGGL